MTRCARSTLAWLPLVAIAVATAACTDSSSPTAPPAARAAAGGGGGGGGGGGQKRLTIVGLNLSSSTLVIGGPGVSYNVTVQNKGGSSVPGVSLQGAIVQGAANHPAGGFAANCPPNPPGVVPSGSCTMTFTATASNAGGTGTLVPGPATFVLTMSLSSGGTPTVVDQTSVPITLAAATQTITSLTLDHTTLGIAVPATLHADTDPYTVVLQNSGSALSGVSIAGSFVQGTVTHESGAIVATCPNTDGTLPNGSCTMNYFAVASNSNAGPGTLVPGPATFVVKLVQTVNGTPTVLDSKSVAVTLVAGYPTISSLSIDPTTLTIGGAAATYTTTLANPDAAWTGVWVKAEVVQGANSGIVGGTYTLCTNVNPLTPGALPSGGCTFSATAAVPGNAPFVAGSANFVLTLYQVVNDVLTQYDTKSIPITLQAAGLPSITSLSLSSTTLAIGGPLVNYTAGLSNPGPDRSGISLVGQITQGSVVAAAGGTSPGCVPTQPDLLPNGTCTVNFTTSASNQTVSGGVLAPGSATFVLTLTQTVNNVTTTLDTKSIPITLVSNSPPTITSVVFDASVPRRTDDGTVILLISQNSSNGYTVTINNPGLQLTGMGIQAEIHQGTAVRGAGGSDLICENYDPFPPGGTLPNGTCSMQFNTTATNTANGTGGDLVEGYADWVLYLQDADGNNVDQKTVRVYLAQQQF